MQMQHVRQTQKHTRHAKPDTIYPAAHVILAPVVAHPRTKIVAALRIVIYRLEQPVLIPPAVIHIHQIAITAIKHLKNSITANCIKRDTDAPFYTINYCNNTSYYPPYCCGHGQIRMYHWRHCHRLYSSW